MLLVCAATGSALAQAGNKEATLPDVGARAPDFALRGATRYGVLAKPVHLSDFKGQTVVLAFFPRARTSGCTIQMRTYRDQYATLLKDGRQIVLIAISTDPADTLAAWARDEQFQFLMASDSSSAVGTQYGTYVAQHNYEKRNLFVVAPDGTIAYRATPFMEIDPTSYVQLGTALEKTVAR